MAYKWLGMRILGWGEVKELHESGNLSGIYRLYPDGTESEIESGYDWKDIEAHHENGGGFGEELPTVDLMLPDGKKIKAPEVVDISALGTLDELEYSLWHTIEEYLVLFGTRTEDDQPDFATVKAVQDKILDVLIDSGVNFKLLSDGQTQAISKLLNAKSNEKKDYTILHCGFNVVVKDEDIDDIMVSALEGGITYWCNRAEVAGEYLGEYASDQISRGGILKLHDGESQRSVELTKEKLMRGLKNYMQHPRANDFLEFVDHELKIDTSYIDAQVADCIVQYAVFGDVIYG